MGMTRERIENFREIVLPFLSRTLLETNYENLGKSDAEEFEKDFNEVLDLAIKALEQEPRWIPVSERYPQIEDEYKYFLVTDEKGKVSVQEFFLSLDEEPQPYFSGMINVIAWMPLPKGYEEVEK